MCLRAAPCPERRETAARTGRALDLLNRLGPGRDRVAYDEAVRNTMVVGQVARQYGLDFADPGRLAACMRHRDETMAANAVWWQRRTGTEVVLSAHDAHVAYETVDPAHNPEMQGAFLRDRLDRVRYRDCAVDLRRLASPARAWPERARPTRSMGTDHPDDAPHGIVLARSPDVLIRFHRVEAAATAPTTSRAPAP